MRIPQYFAQERMEVSQLPRGPGLPRAPARLLADTGKIEEAQALAGFGGALGKIAGMLAEIQAEKQRGRDEAALAKLSDQERDFVFGAHNALEQYVAEDIKDFPELEEDFAKDWDRKIKELVKGRNRQVAEHFQVWADQNRAKILQGYHNKVWRKEQSFGQGQAISIANKNLIRGDLQGALRTYEQHAQYFSPEELQRLKDEAPHALDWYAGIWWAENNPEWLLVQLKDEEKYYTTLNPVEKQRLKDEAERTLAQKSKETASDLKLQQEQEEQNIEKAINENDLNVGRMISNSSISADDKWKWRQRAKSEAEEISDPDTVWQVWDNLDKDIKNYQLAPTEGKRLELQKRLKDERFDKRTLSQKEYTGLGTALESPMAKEDAYWVREARNLLDEAIRERDKFSGMLKTDEALIARAAMAKLQFDKDIEEAAKAGKPLRGRDLMITAMGLVPYFKPKTKLTREESKKWPSVPETLREPEIGINWEEPDTLEDFYETVRKIYETTEFEEWARGEDMARAYYDSWIDKFKTGK